MADTWVMITFMNNLYFLGEKTHNHLDHVFKTFFFSTVILGTFVILTFTSFCGWLIEHFNSLYETTNSVFSCLWYVISIQTTIFFFYYWCPRKALHYFFSDIKFTDVHLFIMIYSSFSSTVEVLITLLH